MIRGENIMRGTRREVREFTEANIVASAEMPAPDTPWAMSLDVRTRLFLTLCAHRGSPSEALALMIEAQGVDHVTGEIFDLGSWAHIDLTGDDPERLYSGLLMDPKAAAFHRLLLQSVLSGIGAATAVKTLLAVMTDASEKGATRVSAARVMADMNGMLASAGAAQIEATRRSVERDGAGHNALPSEALLAAAEAQVQRWRTALAAVDALSLPSPERTE